MTNFIKNIKEKENIMKNWIKFFIEKHIIVEDPYDTACWDCEQKECNPRKCRWKGIIK